MFQFWGTRHVGSLAPWPGIELALPVLEGEVVTSGPTGKSLNFFLMEWNDKMQRYPQTPVGRLHFMTIATSSLEGQISNRDFYFINFFLLAYMIPSKNGGHLNSYEPHTESGMLSPKNQGLWRVPCFRTWAPAQASWHLLLLFFTTHCSSLMACHGPVSLASTWNPSY